MAWNEKHGSINLQPQTGPHFLTPPTQANPHNRPQIPYTKEDYEAAKARDPEFYRGADSLGYGHAGPVPVGNVDKMVNAINAECVKQLALSVRAQGFACDFTRAGGTHSCSCCLGVVMAICH
jgi:hypothetical protein